MTAPSIRQTLEKIEDQVLHPKAARSAAARRAKPEEGDPFRTAFQRDRDRVLHSKAFRRLKHKTQVFLAPEGDHYRTRMTHVLEVAQVARTIARALRLNEDLAEAIALAHDLGHPPFGHVGEQTLNRLAPGGFSHYLHSLRIVEHLANDGAGMNLTLEVKNGIVKHSKGKKGRILDEPAMTLEAQVVRAADLIAYVNHDADDAFRAGFLKPRDVPAPWRKMLGDTISSRLRAIVSDVIDFSLGHELNRIGMSEGMLAALEGMRAFMFERVYESEKLVNEFRKTAGVLEALYEHAVKNADALAAPYPAEDPPEKRALDFIAGMTDRYALNLYDEVFVPRGWKL